jgi:prophage regulatory protein
MRLLRIQEVIQLTGLSRMSIYRFEKSGAFPNRRRIGQNSVRWLDADIERWMESRPTADVSAAVTRSTVRSRLLTR